MFRKQAGTGYAIVVSPLLKKFTSSYGKDAERRDRDSRDESR